MTYFADDGPEINWFCVYWTGSLHAAEQKEGRGVGEGWRSWASSLSATVFSWFLFIDFGRGVYPPCRIFVLFVFAASRCTDPKYTPPVTIIHRSHKYTRLLEHTLLIEERAPPLQPLPAARTHIVSHRHPYLIAADWPPGSRACSETFSLFPFSALVVWNSILTLSIYESLYLSFCVSIYWSVFLCVSSPLLLSQTCSPQGEREGKRQLWLRARSQNLLHLDFITNKPAHGWRIIIKGKKIKEKGGSKACNMVNKFKLSIKKKALILFLCPKPNGNQLLLS